MKHWKKFIFILPLLMSLGFLTSCGNSNKVSKNTLQIYQIGDKPDNYAQLMKIANQRIQDKIGVKINIKYISFGDYEQKMNVIVSSGENYDIAFASNYAINSQKGAYADLTKLLPEYAKDSYNKIDNSYIKGNKVNGKLYAFPVNANCYAQQMLTFNKKYLDEFHLSIHNISSYESAESVLQKFHDQNSNITPLAINKDYIISANMDYPLTNTLPFAVDLQGDKQKIVNPYNSPSYVNILRKMHEWYKKGSYQKMLQLVMRVTI